MHKVDKIAWRILGCAVRTGTHRKVGVLLIDQHLYDTFVKIDNYFSLKDSGLSSLGK